MRTSIRADSVFVINIFYHNFQVEKNQELDRVLNLPDHSSGVMSVDWSSSVSYYTCLTGSQDGVIRVTSLLKQ